MKHDIYLLQNLTEDISLVPLIILLMTFFISLTYICALVSSYLFPNINFAENKKSVDSAMRLLATGYLFLMVFIIVNAWNYKEEARRAVSREASDLSIILRSIHAFPEAEQTKLYSVIANYVIDVRTAEWQEMKRGEESPYAYEKLENLFTALQEYQPRTYQEKIYHKLAIDMLNELIQARRDRISKMESIIPHSLMNIFFWASVTLTCLLGMIRGKDTLSQLSPVLIFAAILGFDLAIALDFDYPFTGSSAVNNRVYYQGALGRIKDPAIFRP